MDNAVISEDPIVAPVADYVKGEVTPAEDVAEQQLEDEKTGHPPYLRKKGTNEIFAYNPYLAERDDMGPWPWPYLTRPEVKPIAEIQKGERIADIMRAISELKPTDFASTGHPRLASLRDKLGYVVKPAERDEAYDLYRKGAR